MNIDKKSHLVTVHTHLKLGELRKKLNHSNYDIGFFAGKSAEDCTLKNILEENIPNLWHLRHGEIYDMCTSLVVSTSIGHIRTKKVPRAATGPDLKKIFMGSRHHYGDIQEVTLQIIPKPELRKLVKINSDKKILQKIWASGIRPLTIRYQKKMIWVELEGIEDIVLAEEDILKLLVIQQKGIL
ncbi:MAG: FAD-binding oxidoreductase [Deltaproteobacteria bacterium]|nr:MAG: FAD-binding oxidoreductase [Deltaproteobacteria bacterium]